MQLSGPVGKRPFTVDEWRRAIGDEPGIKEDIDGTSYALTLSTNSDEAYLGSATQDSLCVVGGAYHLIPAGQPMSIEIPPALTGPRTDLIVVRYDEAFEPPSPDDPLTADRSAPCRLYRIAGTEGSGVPAYDATPPGVEDLPLWEVTRTPGTALSSNGTSRVDRRVRTGPSLYAQSLDHVASGVPLGTVARVGGWQYTRVLDGQGGTRWAGHLVNGQRTWRADRPFTVVNGVQRATDEYTGRGTLVGLTLPSSAPAGEYLVSPTVQVGAKGSGATSAGTLRVTAGGVVMACRADIHDVTSTFTPTFRYVHPGGAVQLTVTHEVNTGVAVVVTAGTGLTVAYVGS